MVQETRSRVAEVERLTRETEVKVSVDLDGTGLTEVETGINTRSSVLTALGRHSLINLEVCAKGDLEVDGHHTTRDLVHRHCAGAGF